MVAVQIGKKCVANMCFATLDTLDEDGSGWYHDQTDGTVFFLAHQHRVFPLSVLTKTITECFIDTSNTLKEQYGSMLDWAAVHTHLRDMWYEACKASLNDEFFHVNAIFDKLENFVAEVGRACGKYATCQVQGVYILR